MQEDYSLLKKDFPQRRFYFPKLGSVSHGVDSLSQMFWNVSQIVNINFQSAGRPPTVQISFLKCSGAVPTPQIICRRQQEALPTMEETLPAVWT